MLTLPVPIHVHPALSQSSKELIEFARNAGLDGTSDATAIVLPDRFSAEECEVFLEFVFNILP
jgi:hypothetical protein